MKADKGFAAGLDWRVRLGCLSLAVLTLLAPFAICSLGYLGLRQAAAAPPPRARQHSLSLGPIRLMSGLTASDPCSAYGANVDSWRCVNTFFARRPGQRAAYRLWLFVTAPRQGVRAYNLVDLPVEPARP